MRTQILTKSFLVFFMSNFLVFCAFGQENTKDNSETNAFFKIESYDGLKVDSFNQKNKFVEDTLPAKKKDSFKKNEAKSIMNEISIDLINGKTRSGYIKKISSDSIYISSNFGKHNFNATEIKTIKTYPEENKSAESALLGVVIGALPGIFMMSRASKSEGILGGFIETVTGAAVGIGGAIAGGIIGAQLGRGITVTYRINGSKEQYNKEKAKIINDAFKI